MLTTDVVMMILAAEPAVIVAARLHELGPDERQRVLCTVCAMHEEITRNCRQTATEATRLLTAECALYVNGVATCAKNNK